ncbi:cache domain-containing protein [Cohnella ginsengisoli]|uniref:Cache domain-containing protein n=1 Tax=Cohnella ginsengisoli TaxID=425004 RepID=A0A9X4KFL8_9BACL|nr:hypothetical protein [Cohnella ginsengisoli]MDG0791050.1 cache domain-containing protein [Cohnella ginsengisoli]
MRTDKLGKLFGNQFIRNKIMAIYLPLILIPLLALGIASNRIYTQSLVDKTIKGVGDNSSLIITRINGILANAQSCANILAINLDRVIQESGAQVGGGDPDISEAARILNQLSFSILVFPEVNSAAFIDLQGRVYATDPRLERGDQDVLQTDIVERIDGTSGENLWFPMARRSYLTPDPGQAVLTLGKRVFNINTGKPIGSIVLNIREEAFSAVYRSIGSFGEGAFFYRRRQGDRHLLAAERGSSAAGQGRSASRLDRRRFRGDDDRQLRRRQAARGALRLFVSRLAIHRGDPL